MKIRNSMNPMPRKALEEDRMLRLIRTVGKSTIESYWDFFVELRNRTKTKSDLTKILKVFETEWMESSITTKVNAGYTLFEEFDLEEIKEEIHFDRRSCG